MVLDGSGSGLGLQELPFGAHEAWVKSARYYRLSCGERRFYLLSATACAVLPTVHTMAKDHREFIVWQLADEVRREVIAITDSEPVNRDWHFRDQIRDACDSACANFAEGFARYKHKHFAQFIRIARGSLQEVIDQLDSALEKRYISADTARHLQRLCQRALSAAAGLIRWLESHPD